MCSLLTNQQLVSSKGQLRKPLLQYASCHLKTYLFNHAFTPCLSYFSSFPSICWQRLNLHRACTGGLLAPILKKILLFRMIATFQSQKIWKKISFLPPNIINAAVCFFTAKLLCEDHQRWRSEEDRDLLAARDQGQWGSDIWLQVPDRRQEDPLLLWCSWLQRIVELSVTIEYHLQIASVIIVGCIEDHWCWKCQCNWIYRGSLNCGLKCHHFRIYRRSLILKMSSL